jgi:hypothetical protein
MRDSVVAQPVRNNALHAALSTRTWKIKRRFMAEFSIESFSVNGVSARDLAPRASPA